MGLFGFSGGVFFLVVLSPAWGFSGAQFASTSPNRCSRAFCGVGASERGLLYCGLGGALFLCVHL